MGHIAHLRKQFKSINTYDYIITLIKRRKNHYQLHDKSLVLHLNKLESPSSKDALCQDWLKLAQWFLEKRIFKKKIPSMYFRYFVIISLGKG